MTSDLDAPDGMALLCQTCRWRPDENMPTGLMVAHFETEHGTTDVRLELVALCPRCDIPMTFDYSHGDKDYFGCVQCRRTRTIRRGGRRDRA